MPAYAKEGLILRPARGESRLAPRVAPRSTPGLSMLHPTQFTGVTVHTKANVYFDGNVVSHTVLLPDGTKKTLGLIRPGTYQFGTAAPERMEIVAGNCEVTLDGATQAATCQAGQSFQVPGNSGFTITVKQGLCEYICSFLP
ncbi:MAG TPA: pyrimidine/purine nucleoside phosphorylase [Candidatus Synoicihabitans sp.]|nr:pyrimidine/purine nucleoside phosphorylase [Candidatus Synoicihabitans sp.]